MRTAKRRPDHPITDDEVEIDGRMVLKVRVYEMVFKAWVCEILGLRYRVLVSRDEGVRVEYVE